MKKLVSVLGLKNIKLSHAGLLDRDVIKQRELFGQNEILEVSGNFWLNLALETFKDPMIWFLLVIGSIFVFIGEFQEGITLFIAMVPLIFMDAILHWRERRSTSTLKQQLGAFARVIRNGVEILIAVKEIVPGDLVVLSAGENLPADGIFEIAEELQIDESVLTGESLSIVKQNGTSYLNAEVEHDGIYVESRCLGYAGSRVQTGRGLLRVLLIGQQTYYGEIIQSVERLPQERTPLQKSISGLVQALVFVAIIFCILLAGVRVYQGYGWLDAILSAATLAVAAIPEEFPVVFSFFLGVGVYRLARKNALVRRAVSVENIGRVTHICTDKTGTITVGQLKLTHYDLIVGVSENHLIEIAASASDPSGADPVDQAINEVARTKALQIQPRLLVFPFTENRKYEAVFMGGANKDYNCHIKGAPETILQKSEINPSEQKKWLEKVSGWAQGGHKVLACASRKISSEEFDQKSEPQFGFHFLGLIIFEDPCRPEVRSAIKYCYQNAIGVLMITGDHPETAIAIAKDVGLGEASPKFISAEIEPEKLKKTFLDANPDFLRHLDIVARCTPLQKLEIVKSLRQAGELVAVTGDGVNDVPALKAADIAIAMGGRGTRSAKEVSAIILADDNFQTIVNAIIEGRQLFFNLKTAFEYLLLIHIPFVLTAALIPLMGYPLLYLPVHIVWLELIIHPTALFAFQKMASRKNKNQKEHSKHYKEARFFSLTESVWIFVVGLLFSIVLAYDFITNKEENLHPDYGRTKAILMLIVWSAGVVLIKTGLKNYGAFLVFCGSLLTVLLAVQVPFLTKILHITTLQLFDWLMTISLVLVFLILYATGKRITRSLSSTK